MVKTFNQEVIDAINNLLKDNTTTRTLITTENKKIEIKLDELIDELKKSNLQLEFVTDEDLASDNIE